MNGVGTNPGTPQPRNAYAGLSLAGLRAWKSWFIAFPGLRPSGVLMNPHFLTVAGAAPESTVQVSPASRFTRHGKPCAGTTNGAEYSKALGLCRALSRPLAAAKQGLTVIHRIWSKT